MTNAAEKLPDWVSLAAEAKRRGMEPGELRDHCKRLRVTLLGTVKRPVVSPAEIDAAFSRQARAIASNDADFAEIERGAGRLPRLAPR